MRIKWWFSLGLFLYFSIYLQEDGGGISNPMRRPLRSKYLRIGSNGLNSQSTYSLISLSEAETFRNSPLLSPLNLDRVAPFLVLMARCMR